VHAYVSERDDERLRRDLLQRIHWDCGKPDLAGVMQEIEERLVVLGRDRFNLPATEARRLANVLIYHVLKRAVLKNASDRFLTRAELYGAIDAATRVSVSRQTAGSVLDIGAAAIAIALASGQSLDAAFSAVDTSWLTPSSDLPSPHGIIARRKFASQIEHALTKYGGAIRGRQRAGKIYCCPGSRRDEACWLYHGRSERRGSTRSGSGLVLRWAGSVR